jgi:glutamate/tyrosine decarboxylase-like PLP-dependent enzyme
VAVDPHKWLYAPLEAGAVLVRDSHALTDTFSYRPAYYELDEGTVNFYERGPQNSRGFRALKVWLAMRHAGRRGYTEAIAEDCRLARLLYQLCETDPELEARTCSLSISTFRYRPDGVGAETLDRLNQELLERVQHDGEAFISNAVVDRAYYLRACFVNFRTTEDDVRALVEIVKRTAVELRTPTQL